MQVATLIVVTIAAACNVYLLVRYWNGPRD